jgi:hypothetical protein
MRVNVELCRWPVFSQRCTFNGTSLKTLCIEVTFITENATGHSNVLSGPLLVSAHACLARHSVVNLPRIVQEARDAAVMRSSFLIL